MSTSQTTFTRSPEVVAALLGNIAKEPLFEERRLVYSEASLFKTYNAGMTRAQGERFFRRLNAVKAARRIVYRDGSTVQTHIDDLVLVPQFERVETLPAGRLKVHHTNGVTCVVKTKEAIAYTKVLLDMGDFARNY